MCVVGLDIDRCSLSRFDRTMPLQVLNLLSKLHRGPRRPNDLCFKHPGGLCLRTSRGPLLEMLRLLLLKQFLPRWHARIPPVIRRKRAKPQDSIISQVERQCLETSWFCQGLLLTLFCDKLKPIYLKVPRAILPIFFFQKKNGLLFPLGT